MWLTLPQIIPAPPMVDDYFDSFQARREQI
jgi:hypothetical protein